MLPVDQAHILLVEDNPADAALLQEHLAADGALAFRITHCQDLAQAFAFLARSRCDVIALDLHLPGSTGLATFARVKARAGGIPIVILTGGGDEQAAATALEQGAHHYLRKDGLSTPLLVRTIATALREQQPWQTRTFADAEPVVSR